MASIHWDGFVLYGLFSPYKMMAFLTMPFGHMEDKALDKQDRLSCSCLHLSEMWNNFFVETSIYQRLFRSSLAGLLHSSVFTYSPTKCEFGSIVLICPPSIIFISVYFPEDSTDCPPEDVQKSTVQWKDPLNYLRVSPFFFFKLLCLP